MFKLFTSFKFFRLFLPVIFILSLFVCAGCNQRTHDKADIIEESDKNEVPIIPEAAQKSEKDDKLPPNPPKGEYSNLTKSDEMRHKKSMKVKVYYPDESGLHLVAVKRDIVVDDKVDKYTAAVAAVLTPPVEKNLANVVANPNSLLGVKVKDGTAVVNLSKNIKKGFSGGSTGEEFLIGSVVNTLTEFDEIKDVKFLMDGQQIETLSGHMDLSTPVKRMAELINQ